jgi:hypothetical protein
MKLQFRSPLLGASHHPPAWYVLLAPKSATRFQSRLQLSPRPHPNYNQTHSAPTLLPSTPSSRSLSPNLNTIEFA